MKGYITYPTYETINNETIIQLYGKLENGESFVTQNKLIPYFYIKESDLDSVSNLLSKYKTEKTDFTTFDNKKVTKIIAENQAELNKLYQAIYKKIYVYEADIKPHLRFLIDNDILGTINILGDYQSAEKINRIYNSPEIKPIDYKPKLKIASIDIEADKKSGDLFCIGIYSDNYKKVFMITSHNLKNTLSCKTESECLEKFKAELIKLDPDIITGWNVIDFDLVYLKQLFAKHNISFDLGRSNAQVKLRIESNFFRSSSADMPGRQVLDTLNLIRDPFIQEAPTIKHAKFESYKLEDVSQAILNEGKLIKGRKRHDEIESLYSKNSQEAHQKLSDYNLLDCQLVYKILEKTKIIELAIERSQLIGLTLDRITSSIAAFDSLYIREARKRKLVCPTTYFGNKEEKIMGGFVLSENPGIYHNVLVLDFKSLYPSIIKTFNIDPSSYLEKKEKDAVESPNKAYFKNRAGILPEIITKLHNAREKAKAEKREFASYAIKIIQNSFFGVLASPNCRFFNLKMANAITHFGQFIIKLTAKEIEKIGFKTIYTDSVSENTEIIVKNKDNDIKFIKIRELFKKVKKIGLEEKEYDFPNDVSTLTLNKEGKSVFKPIIYIMRHKVSKKMYRIWFTNTSYIDVTEDHSLIGYSNKSKDNNKKLQERLVEVKPTEIGKKIKSIVNLKKIPRSKINTKNYPKELYEFMGYFIGDGSFARNKSHQKYNKDYYLNLAGGLDTSEIIEKLIKPLQITGFIKNYWTRKSGDIMINGLKIVNIIAKELRNESGKKIIPAWLREEKEENISAFLRGLFSADGTVITRDNSPIIRFTNIDEDIIKETRKLLYFLGISNSHFKENKPNKYKDKISNTYSKHIIIKDGLSFKQKVGFIIERKQNRLDILKGHKSKINFYNYNFDLSKVIKIEEINYNGPVYDIEVEKEHRFFANNVLVHNTDSVFIETKLEKEKALQLGNKIQAHINNFYKEYVKNNYNRQSYLELEFKKLYLSLMLPKLRTQEAAAKKRYAGLIEINGKEEIEITGLEAIRGDWTEAAQEFQKELLLKVFHNEDIKPFIRAYIKKIKSGELDSKLIYKKSIRKELEKYTKITPPHVKAARQLENLESNTIEYYITTNGPEPLQKLKHKIDYEHYIKRQIEPIANQILILFNKNFEDFAEDSKQAKLF